MNLEIKKHKKSKGKFVQKNGGIKNVYKTKKWAIKDIIEIESFCFIHIEHFILNQHKIRFEIIPFNI
jgi:hypothetical protein